MNQKTIREIEQIQEIVAVMKNFQATKDSDDILSNSIKIIKEIETIQEFNRDHFQDVDLIELIMGICKYHTQPLTPEYIKNKIFANVVAYARTSINELSREVN